MNNTHGKYIVSIIIIIIIIIRLSKPISTKITNLLYTDDMELFAASGNKLKRVMTVAKNGL